MGLAAFHLTFEEAEAKKNVHKCHGLSLYLAYGQLQNLPHRQSKGERGNLA